MVFGLAGAVIAMLTGALFWWRHWQRARRTRAERTSAALRRAEELGLKREQDYLALLSQISDAVLLFDAQLVCVAANRAATKLLLCERTELHQLRYDSIFPDPSPGASPADGNGAPLSGLWDGLVRRRDGELLTASINVVRFGDGRLQVCVRETAAAKPRPTTSTLGARMPLGSSVGQVAHELNNQLLTISANLDLLHLASSASDHSICLESIRRAADAGAGNVRDLFAIAHIDGSTSPAAITRDLHATIQQIGLGAADRRTKTILLVDDNDGVRVTLRRALLSQGYGVLAVASAREVPEAVRDQAHIDLLVTDVAMPDISGPSLADAMRANHPGLKVLFISGHPLSEREAVAAHGAFLRKPFSTAALASQIDALLGSQLSG